MGSPHAVSGKPGGFFSTTSTTASCGSSCLSSVMYLVNSHSDATTKHHTASTKQTNA